MNYIVVHINISCKLKIPFSHGNIDIYFFFTFCTLKFRFNGFFGAQYSRHIQHMAWNAMKNIINMFRRCNESQTLKAHKTCKRFKWVVWAYFQIYFVLLEVRVCVCVWNISNSVRYSTPFVLVSIFFSSPSSSSRFFVVVVK